MTFALYIARDTPLHRIPPAAKLLALVVAGIGVFLIPDPLWLLPLLAAIAVLFVVAQVPLGATARQLKPVAFLLVIIFLAHGAFTSWTLGVLVVLRFLLLLMMALLVSFTTRVSDMIETIETVLRPLANIGLNPAKVSLALSLALRFIPILAEMTHEIREAQRARGLDRNIIAIAVPLLVRTLRLANTLTEAIEARGWDPDPPARIRR
ncbi:MAG: energy-coupling factor transporter transmembrane protein EcfT [Rhodospirillales bacterium]|nr:energy-coupling factor transporter transmembrane protein EcfT [Rhodospirillales bacterium]